jgi:VanZ family protein
MPRPPLIRRLGLWAPPIIYMMVIFLLSAQSNPMPAVTTRVWDKLLHLTEYGGLALLFCRALVGEGLGWLATMLAAIALTSIYGASDEWHQMFTPMRSADVRDWVADTLGGTVGVVVYVAGRIARGAARTEP